MAEWYTQHQAAIIFAFLLALLLSHFWLLVRVSSIGTALERLQISVVADRNKRPK